MTLMLKGAAVGLALALASLPASSRGQCAHETKGTTPDPSGLQPGAAKATAQEAAAVQPGETNAGAPASPVCPAEETKASVPELSAFHEVIYPMWHTAWATKDTAMVRALWPDLQTHVAAVAKAELPGILRDKEEPWQKGIERLKAAEAGYGAALAGDAMEPKLAAVEEMHASFESLVRTIRPVLPELQAFHEVLYRIYHYDLPNEDQKALSERLPALTAAMETLNAAVLPERRAAAQANFDAARAELSARVDEVTKIATEDHWTQTAKAIEDMHSAYQAVERVFD